MTHLVVTMPVRPVQYAKDTRLQYRVVLTGGKVLRLRECADSLKIPYSSLAARVHKELATVGIHEESFLKIVAEVKKRARSAQAGQVTCPHCAGRGWMPAVPHARLIRTCVQCGCDHRSNPEFDTCSACRAKTSPQEIPV